MYGLIRQFRFGSNDLGRLVVPERVTRTFAPEIARSSVSVGRYGVIASPVRADGRKVTVTCRLFPESADDGERVLSLVLSMLQTDKPQELKLYDSQWSELCVLTGASSVERWRHGIRGFELEFLNVLGVYLGEERSVTAKQVFIQGTEPTPARIHIKANSTSGSVTITTDESVSQIKLTDMKSGTTYTIDTERRCLFEGTVPRPGLISYDSTFPHVGMIGNVQINTSGIATTADGFRMDWRERWK